MKLLNNNLYFSIVILTLGYACNLTDNQEKEGADTDISEVRKETEKIVIPKEDTIEIEAKIVPPCDLALRLKTAGLVNVQAIDTSLKVRLMYSSIDNFMHQDVYGCLDSCYLQPDVAEKLKNAQHFLQEKHANYSLIIYDGVRPRAVQQLMWDSLKMPFEEKIKFVSNPKNGSLHNYGAAVDLSIVNTQRDIVLDMGTPVDFPGELAWPTKEKENLKNGLLSQEVVNNRKLLRNVMYKGGFFNIQTEWWHFNSCRRSEAQEKYQIVE